MKKRGKNARIFLLTSRFEEMELLSWDLKFLEGVIGQCIFKDFSIWITFARYTRKRFNLHTKPIQW